jgi:diphthamide synthase (EF-2-diphthine--ammonia ligase)
MIQNNMDCILIKVAAFGLDPKLHLGRTIAELYDYFIKIV